MAQRGVESRFGITASLVAIGIGLFGVLISYQGCSEYYPGSVVVRLPPDFGGIGVIMLDQGGDPAGKKIVELDEKGMGRLDGPYPYHWFVVSGSITTETEGGPSVPWEVVVPGADWTSKEVACRDVGYLPEGSTGVAEWWVHVGDMAGYLEVRQLFGREVTKWQQKRRGDR